MARGKSDDGSMTVKEAGKRGGRKTLEEYGPEFYSKIGQRGGEESGKRRRQNSEDRQSE